MTDATPHRGTDDAVNARVERVEDRTAFTEHTVDQLNAELVRAVRVIERLTQRIESLERRLTDVERAPNAASRGDAPRGSDANDGDPADDRSPDVDQRDASGGLELPPHAVHPDHHESLRRRH